jgi:hypothetical protein
MARERASASRGLLSSYLRAKVAVCAAGFEHEVTWQEQRSLDRVDDRVFLREAAWVVLSSGMRESVVRRVFPAVSAAFGDWLDAHWIVKHAATCKARALRAFAHAGKINALLQISRVVATVGLAAVLGELRRVGPGALEKLPYMGPATSRHLAKNLGLDVAKPDRHLVRVAQAAGYSSPAKLCAQISLAVGDTVAVVDLVIWRYATLSPDYERFFAGRMGARARAAATGPAQPARA